MPWAGLNSDRDTLDEDGADRGEEIELRRARLDREVPEARSAEGRAVIDRAAAASAPPSE